MPLQAWSSAAYTVPLPPGHRFPIEKYALLRDAVLTHGLVALDAMHDPPRVDPGALARVHDGSYVRQIADGTIAPAALRRIGFPWSPGLVERSHRAVGGTVAAAHAALEQGVAINLAGGTHHAFSSHGEGFCVFNDVAVAIRALQAERLVHRAVVIDLDVHQGNGTHAIFAGDDRVFTFSMHGRRNFPFHKVPGALDIELEDRTGDEEYLSLLASALPQVLSRARADIAIYLAGADPHEGDRLGRLSLTHAALARRDAMVLDACREIGLPVAITIAGGYGRRIETTIAVHVATVRLAATYC